MPICDRHVELLNQLTIQGNLAKLAGVRSNDYKPFNQALARLQAHNEVCKDCRQILADAFPELRGKTLTIENLSGITLVSEEG